MFSKTVSKLISLGRVVRVWFSGCDVQPVFVLIILGRVA